MLRDSRRRSPESSRRRRAERRHSREQLAAVAATAGPSPTYIPGTEGPPAPRYPPTIPHPQHQPSNVSLRSRADSSTSNTSSTSSSLLNISRKPRGFGIRSFFTSSSKSKKKKRRAFRSKNSSSSSVDSDLAYGKGYIPKSAVNSPRRAPGHPSYRDASAPAFGPDGRPALRRGQTDEEILELGRQLSLYARAENDKDLMRAGRSRPSQIAAGVAVAGLLSRHKTSDSHGARGIGSSKPNRRHDSDDSDWESASDDEGSSSDDYDVGLAYGSAQFSSTHLPQTSLPTHTAAPAIISQPPPEDIRPPYRKPSAVDPAMFGPVNSLRGYINTPCGFRPGEYQRPQPPSYDPQAPVPQSTSASIEANRNSQQPMRVVYPVPTSDPGRFETTGSVISGYTQHPHESPISVSRPAPVVIQAPKPMVPVSTRRLEEDRYHERERGERRKSDGSGLAEAALAGAAAAAIGGAVLSSSRDKREREKESRRAEEDRESARKREKEARRLEEEREAARKREKEARRVVEEREKEARRLSEERALADREYEKRRSRDTKDEARRGDKKSEEKQKDKKPRDSTTSFSNALVVDERVAEAKRKEERRRERRERQRKELEEIQAEIEREKARLLKEGKEIPIITPTEPPPSRKSRKKEAEVGNKSAPSIDPFQFQVDDDAFQTPQFATPARPLTPAVMTVEREPKWDDDVESRERMSRKDSYEQEQAQVRAVLDETEHSTIPAHPEVIAAVIAAANDKDRRRTREAEPTRDPIEEANRWYRLKKEAEREEECRSRSPEPSVLEKYQHEGEEPVMRIVTPPAMEHPHDKSKYDGPNADVRIDHIITPRELPMFRRPPTSLDPNRDSPPQWKSRDPSCERERPLLNLVRPTPEPTPTPEMQRGRAASRSRSRSPSPSLVIGPRGEIRQAPPDTPTSKSVTWGENDTKHYNPSSPDRTAQEREAAEKLQSVLGNKKKPGSGWGDLAAAFAAAAAAGTLPGMSSKPAAPEETKQKSRDVAETKERAPSPPPTTEWKRSDSPTQATRVLTASPARTTAIVDDYDQPPQPGPKPSSPSHHVGQKQMPGAFADDLDFAAHLAAGLESSGFDPNIVIEDPTYRKRDSPPGSNKSKGSSKVEERRGASPPSSSKLPYQKPFAETVTDLGIVGETVAHAEPRERGFVVGEVTDTPASVKGGAPVENEWEPTPKSMKVKKSKRNTIDLADEQPMIAKEEPTPEPESEPKLSKKEQKKRDKAARLREFDDESSTARERDVVVAEPGEPEWTPKLSKKEQKKRDRAARDEGSSTPRETEPESVVAAQPEDEWKEEKGKKGKKKGKSDRGEDREEGSFTPREAQSVVDALEADWADAKSGKKDKKKKRGSTRAEDFPARSEVNSERAVTDRQDEDWADAEPSKDKKKRGKAPLEEESFTSGVLVSEPAPLEDEWEEQKPSKKDKKAKKNQKSGLAWDDVEEAAPSDDRSVSVPVDAFSDLQRTAAQDDEWDTPSKKSKKKSKRDSTYDSYDSPSRPVAQSEVSVESSSKKDRKSKRDSAYDTYDSPSSKKDKKSRRKSTKDSYDRPDEGEPPDRGRDSFKPVDRDVSSLVSEPTRYERQSNGSWADEVEEAQSVVSAPPSSDRKDRKKRSSKDGKDEKSSKDEKRSSGGFFGLFKGTNGGSEKDSDNKDKQSFLGNAGILGAGAGLAGAALASALVGSGADGEESARPKATRGTSGKEDQPSSPTTRAVFAERSATPPGRARSISLGSQLVDPEIVQRVIKPAIDPQYGDLLPLPPSAPGSPDRELDMELGYELPALPESRPDTPPAQQQQERTSLSTTKTHARRRSAFETPTKSPSQTAIPIHFRLGQRSVPPSPGMARSSPVQSPSIPVPELGSVPKPRSRPNSWGRQMLGEPKPLYLVEKASSGSLSTDFEDQQYPALPPSEPASNRESPAPEIKRWEGDVDYLSLGAPQEHEHGQMLRLDTALAALDRSEPLGSADLTPKAERALELGEMPVDPRRQSVGSQSMDDSFHSAAQSPVYQRDSFAVADHNVGLPGDRALAGFIPGKASTGPESPRGQHGYLDELPPLPASSGTSLADEPLAARDSGTVELAPEEVGPADSGPAPAEAMTERRISPSTETLTRSGVEDVTVSPSHSRKVGDQAKSDVDIAAGVAAGLFGTGVVAALMHETSSGKHQSASEEPEKSVTASKPESPSGSIKSAEELLTPDEFSFIPIKRGKKGKKARTAQKFDSPLEPESESVLQRGDIETPSLPEQEATLEKEPTPETTDALESLETPVQAEEFATPLPIPSSTEGGQDQGDDFFEHSTSKKGKKKQNKAAPRGWAEESPTIEQQPDAAAAPLERSISVSSKKGKKKKGKQAFVWEPEEPADGSTPAEGSSTTPTGDAEPPKAATEDADIAAQVQLPESRPVSPPLAEEQTEASAAHQMEEQSEASAPLQRSTSKKEKKKKKKGRQVVSWEPEEPVQDGPNTAADTSETVPESSRAADLAPEEGPPAPLSEAPPSLSQEQTLVAEPASESRDMGSTEAEADEPQPQPEADAESEWAFTPAKKGKKDKNGKKGKRSPPSSVEEPPEVELPKRSPEPPATEAKEAQVPAEQSPVEEALPGTFPETPGIEVTEREVQATDTLSSEPLPGGFPETPATEVNELGVPTANMPAIPSQEETLVEREETSLPGLGPSDVGLEPEPEEWQPTAKKSKKDKKAKKGKKQALAWDVDEPTGDQSPSEPISAAQTEDNNPPEPFTTVRDPKQPMGGLPSGFIEEEVPPAVREQAGAVPEEDESFAPVPTKKGKKDKKGKKGKKTQIAWEPEESAPEEVLGTSISAGEPSASEEPSMVLSSSLSSHPPVSESEQDIEREQPASSAEATIITSEQPVSSQEDQDSGPATSELATVSNKPPVSDEPPIAEQPTVPGTAPKTVNRSMMPSSSPEVLEQFISPVTPPKHVVSERLDLIDAINTPLPDDASAMALEGNEKPPAPAAPPGQQPSPSSQNEKMPAAPSLNVEPASDTQNNGLVGAALSIIPSVAAVGGLFGLGKSKQPEPDTDAKASDITSTRDKAVLADEEPSAASLTGEKPAVSSVDTGPTVGPTADMQPLAPASESAQATHEGADTATVLVPDQQDDSTSKSVHGITSPDLEDNKTVRVDEPSTQETLHHEAVPIIATERSPVTDTAPSSDTMDWELGTGSGKKKGKKGKKGRAKAQDDAAFEVAEPFSTSKALATESDLRDGNQEPQDTGADLQDMVTETPSAVVDDVTAEARVETTPDDEWVLPAKKGKKDKKDKKKRKSTSAFDSPASEPVGEAEVSDIPSTTQEGASASMKVPQLAKETLVVDAPAPAEPSAEDMWAETTAKKGKKGKKKQKSQPAWDVLDPAPSGTSTPLESTEDVQPPAVAVENEEQQEPSAPEPSIGPSAGVLEEPAAEDLWAEASSKNGKKGKKNKKQSAQGWEPEPAAAAAAVEEETPDLAPAADASKSEAQESNQPEQDSAATGQDNLEATADDIWGEPVTKKGKKGKKDKKRGPSKTSSGVATPAIEEHPVVEDTLAPEETSTVHEAAVSAEIPAPAEAEHFYEPSLGESISAVGPTPAEESVAARETLAAEIPVAKETRADEDSTLQQPAIAEEHPASASGPSVISDLPAAELSGPAVETPVFVNTSTTESLPEAEPTIVHHLAHVIETPRVLDQSTMESSSLDDQSPVASRVVEPSTLEDIPTVNDKAATPIPADPAQRAQADNSSLVEAISVTPVSLEEVRAQQPTEASADDIWGEPSKRSKKDKKGKKEREPANGADVELPLTENATVPGHDEAAEQPTQTLSDLIPTEAAAVPENLTSDVLAGGQKGVPDVGGRSIQTAPVEPLAESVWEEPTSAKKGKRGKKNKRATKDSEFEQLETAQKSSDNDASVESSQTEAPLTTANEDLPREPGDSAVEAAADDIWEETSSKKGKKSKLSRQSTFEEPIQPETTKQVDDAETPEASKETSPEAQQELPLSEEASTKEVEGGDPWAEASTKKSKKGKKKKDKAQPFSWDEPAQTEGPRSLEPTVSTSSAEGAPDVDIQTGGNSQSELTKAARSSKPESTAEEPAEEKASVDLASREVAEYPVIPPVSDEPVATGSAATAEPASSEELLISRNLPSVMNQHIDRTTAKPDTAAEAADLSVHDSATHPDHGAVEAPVSITEEAPDKAPSLPLSQEAPLTITQSNEPSHPTTETGAEVSKRETASGAVGLGDQQTSYNEPSDVPSPFQEDLSALLPTSPYSVSLRKSKKDKKKRQSSQTETAEASNLIGDDNQNAGFPDSATTSEDVTSRHLTPDAETSSKDLPPLEDMLDLPQSFTLKRSKKDKKNGKAKAMPWDDAGTTSEDTTSDSWSTPLLPATQLSTIMEASTEDLSGSVVRTKHLDDVAVAEQQAEVALEEQQPARTISEDQTAELPQDYASDASQKTEKAPSEAPPETPVDVEPSAEDDTFSWPTKKDKKDKKGKKSKSIQSESTAIEESKPPSEEGATADRSAGNLLEEEAKDDDFATLTPGKKGKKGKKNKRSTFTWDEPEPELPSEAGPSVNEVVAEKDPADETVLRPSLEDAQSRAVEDLPTVSHPAETENDIPTAGALELPDAKLSEAQVSNAPDRKQRDLAEQPPQPEPDVSQEAKEAEDDWAFPVDKKSKKGKKGKKDKAAKSTEFETPSGTATPLVEDALATIAEPSTNQEVGPASAILEDNKEPDAAQEPPQSEPSQLETQAEDIWGTASSKKSKKEKKKKKGSKVSDSEPASGAQTPVQEKEVPAIMPVEASAVEIQQAAEPSVVGEEPANVARAAETHGENVRESQPKEPKEEKTPEDSELADIEIPSETPVEEPTAGPSSREVEGLPPPELAEPVNRDVPVPAAVPEPEEVPVPEVEAQPEAEDFWAISAKKSKKDKKRKGSKLVEVATPSGASAQPPSDELAGSVDVKDKVPVPARKAVPEAEVAAEPEPQDLWAVSTKKSKKDKKRKGSKFADAESSPGTATPAVQEESRDLVLDSSTADVKKEPTIDDQQEDVQAKDEEGKGKQAAAGVLAGAAVLSTLPDVADLLTGQKDNGNQPSQELVQEVEKEVEPDDFWETPAKKSKKDKKGKKNASRSASGTATPAREEEVIPATTTTVDRPEVPAAAIETAPEQDDFPEFTTKKSKKDKKKKGKQVAVSDLSATPSSQEENITETQKQKASEPDLAESDVSALKSESQDSAEAPSSSKIEINPAFQQALRLSPDHGLKALLPNVGTLGFIEPHVLYPADTPSPKLLTGSPPPKELLGAPPEVTEASHEVDMTPAQESGSRVSHSPPFDSATQRKRAKTIEADPNAAGETVNPAREIAASYLEDKSQVPAEDAPGGEPKEGGRGHSVSASRTPSRDESRDITASGPEDKRTESGPQMVLTEEPMAMDTEPEPSALDIAAAVLEVGPKSLLVAEHKPGVDDFAARASKIDDPPSPEAKKLAASWLEHEHEQHHHGATPPARSEQDDTANLEAQERQLAKDEAVKSASPRAPSPENALTEKTTSSKKKAKLPTTQEDNKEDAAAAAAAGALAGGVTLLAEKFGGSKKRKGKQKKLLDKRTVREDDLFDDPALWEGADRRPLDGSRMDENADGFWDVPDAVEEVEEERRDVGGDEKAEERDRDVVMGGTGEQSVLRLREVVEEAAGDYVESPTLGRRASERKREAERRNKSRQEDDATEIRPVQRAFSFPDDIADEDVSSPATAAAPIIQRELVEDNIEDYSPVSRTAHQMSTIPDFRRSVPSLPPVQEEAPEELEPEKHFARHLTRAPEENRDSGFLSDSPASQRRSHRFEDDSHRDSGVHLKDWPEGTPPRTSQARFDAHPARDFGSSLKTETHSHEREHLESPRAVKRSSESSKDTPRGLGHTPKLKEPSPPPRTPEPQKSLARKRTTRQLDNEPTPERNVGAALTPVPAERRVASDNSALRQYSRSPAETSSMIARRSASNTSITRHRTPEPLNLRPDTPGSIRSLHSATPPLRRVDKRVSGDLRSVSLSQRSLSEMSASGRADNDKHNKDAATAAALGVAAGAAALALAANSRASQNTTPVANEGRVRTKDMADVYDGFGEGRIGSPRSPTRPHSMRRRQSMQVLDLENKVKELEAENQALSNARMQVEQTSSQRASMALAQRDAEIDSLKSNIAFLQKEVERLTEVNEGLSSANAQIAVTHSERYRRLESQHAEAARELEQARAATTRSLQEKDAEIAALRSQLQETQSQIRRMQEQILSATTSSSSSPSDFLRIRDVDHFDQRCQSLCSHVQQWVLRFSKFSDMRACRLTSEINDEKIIDRLDNAVLDGSDVDTYLNDRVRRRDIFMSMTMTMIWEFVFTRYLFGMDREQRQKLKSLEKTLLEVGPPHAVRQWRAITLTLLASRPQFQSQRDADTEAVVQAVFQTLSVILPPPTNMEDQIQSQLRKVLREAVDLAVEMRTQRAEYVMLPPLQPEYDDTGELTETVAFNAGLMHERSGEATTDEEWEAAGSVVRVVLFPLVVKKGDDEGRGDDEVVVCPAQVLVARPRGAADKRSIRMVTPSSDAGGASLMARSMNSPAGTVMMGHGRNNGSNVSMGGGAEGEFI
ncbi:Involucrin repeat protein [Coniochaeta hoffmannii]|uniref:Involucrin repeat protein n=1 Tax=Coniochaeta hoffmannii TaxID=91930 RepID=A0AA38VV64_9PEZI|nr:Involucrin repeat protein [Coniochaeta hoffmannii]